MGRIEDIPASVEEILRHYDTYVENAYRCFRRYYCFEENFGNVLKVLQEISRQPFFSMTSRANVSVVIPIKGRPQLFELTAQSLVDQTYLHWEALVVDDGSTPEDFSRIAEIAGRDQRMRLMKNTGPRRGASASRNAGLAASRGEYVVFLDSDDALASTCLQRRVEVMKSNPKVDFAVFQAWVFRATPGDTRLLFNRFTSENDLDRFLRSDTSWNTSGPIWKKTSLRQERAWDDRALCLQDWEFHIRAIAAGLSYIKVPQPDSFYRVSKTGSISTSSASRRHVCNRVRLFKRLIASLRSEGALTRRRRRSLAAEFYVHAFRLGLNRRLGLKIWCTGRQTRVVGPLQFVAVLASECARWMADRASRSIARFLFPELRMVRTIFLDYIRDCPREIVVEEPEKSVCKPPGSTIVTSMPSGPTSLTSTSEKPSTPHLAAE